MKYEIDKETGELRIMLRNAWNKLKCRCLFDDQNVKIAEDPHCPYHGWQQHDADAWDPIGDLERELAKVTEERDSAIRLMDEKAAANGRSIERAVAAEASAVQGEERTAALIEAVWDGIRQLEFIAEEARQRSIDRILFPAKEAAKRLRAVVEPSTLISSSPTATAQRGEMRAMSDQEVDAFNEGTGLLAHADPLPAQTEPGEHVHRWNLWSLGTKKYENCLAGCGLWRIEGVICNNGIPLEPEEERTRESLLEEIHQKTEALRHINEAYQRALAPKPKCEHPPDRVVSLQTEDSDPARGRAKYTGHRWCQLCGAICRDDSRWSRPEAL